jgi:hypothetical protein
MLWEMLVAVGAVMFVVVPVRMAWGLGAGLGSVVLAAGGGLILAAAYELVVHRVAERLDGSLQRRSDATRSWYVRLMYVGVVLVPLFTLICGDLLIGYCR